MSLAHTGVKGLWPLSTAHVKGAPARSATSPAPALTTPAPSAGTTTPSSPVTPPCPPASSTTSTEPLPHWIEHEPRPSERGSTRPSGPASCGSDFALVASAGASDSASQACSQGSPTASTQAQKAWGLRLSTRRLTDQPWRPCSRHEAWHHVDCSETSSRTSHKRTETSALFALPHALHRPIRSAHSTHSRYMSATAYPLCSTRRGTVHS